MSEDTAWNVSFSYVLHEHSARRSVREAVDTAKRFSQRRSRLGARFKGLSDPELQQRVHVTPHLERPISPALVLSPNVGLPELLPRVLRVTELTTAEHTVDFINPLDTANNGSKYVYVHLFGAPARILSPGHLSINGPCLVASCVVRPGGASLMVTGDLIQEPLCNLDTDPQWRRDTLRAIETIVREHVDQWTPAAPLWDKPVEETLPEFIRSTPTR